MERRGFLKSLAAGLTTPVLASLAVDRNPVIPWDLFCDPDCLRFDLSAPWYADGRLIASDARILVSEIGFSGVGERLRVPNVSTLPWDQSDGTGWTSILNLKRTYGGAKCEHCFGRGRIKAIRCDCETSETNTDSSSQFPGRCLDCSQTGWLGLACPQCDGTGESDYFYDLRGQRFNPSYIGRIKMIGDVDCQLVESDDDFLKSVMVFRFGSNGYGLLCSMHQP